MQIDFVESVAEDAGVPPAPINVAEGVAAAALQHRDALLQIAPHAHCR